MLLIDYITNYFKYGTLGNSLRIDASNFCQLGCPCFQQVKLREDSSRRKHLRFEDFRKFVDQHPTFKNIELSDNGEIFLNPELEEIIRYAYTQKIGLTVRNGVNLNDATEKVLECLVKYKVRVLLVSIDGATDEIYKIYRRGGNFQKVVANIKTINRFKQQYRSKFPILVWQFIVFGHNETEIPLARQMSRELDMRFFLKFNLTPGFSPVKDTAFVRKECGFACAAEYEDKTNSTYGFSCHQLWTSPQIGPDGDLLGCCYSDMGGFYGNVFQEGLQKVLKSEKFIYGKKMLCGLVKARQDIPCFYCDVYKNMRFRKVNLVAAFFSLLKRLRKVLW